MAIPNAGQGFKTGFYARENGWISLNQANRNGRIRTSIAPQRVINCAALPIKLHPITDAQQGGTRRHTHFGKV